MTLSDKIVKDMTVSHFVVLQEADCYKTINKLNKEQTD